MYFNILSCEISLALMYACSVYSFIKPPWPWYRGKTRMYKSLNWMSGNWWETLGDFWSRAACVSDQPPKNSTVANFFGKTHTTDSFRDTLVWFGLVSRSRVLSIHRFWNMNIDWPSVDLLRFWFECNKAQFQSWHVSIWVGLSNSMIGCCFSPMWISAWRTLWWQVYTWKKTNRNAWNPGAERESSQPPCNIALDASRKKLKKERTNILVLDKHPPIPL